MNAIDRSFVINGLRQHLVEWGDGGRVVLLLHGFLEHAHAWDFVAPRLAAGGLHVFALDWRGHGDSEWVGPGGYYHFADYVADLAVLTRVLGGEVALVGHSMGAGAALLYAGTEPDRVHALACIDALGPLDMPIASAPMRYAAWVEDLERVAARGRRALARGDAAARLAARFPRWPAAVARHMAEHGIRIVDGEPVWKFDPLHQTTMPQPYYVTQAREFWSRITCPALYLEGGESELHLDAAELEDRLSRLRARRVTIAGAGHHPHLERPDETAAVLRSFLEGR